MDEYEEYFVTGSKQLGIKGCVNNGINEEKARQLWAVMAEASKYSFNKSHAVAYSMHSFRTAWLAYYYPYEYMTAVLNSYIKNADRIALYLGVAKRKGMKILPPSINESNLYFSTNGEHIRLGLSGLRSVAGFASKIIEDRNEKGSYSGLKDFLERMSYLPKFTIKVLESFIYAGVFDEYEGSRQDKIEQINYMNDYVKKCKDYRKKLNDGKVHKNLVEPTFELKVENKVMPEFERILKEKQFSGMYITGSPLDEFKSILSRYKLTKLDDIYSVIDDENDIAKKAIKGTLKIAGIIKDVEIKSSKRGNSFYTFEVEDESHSMKCVYFGKRDSREKDVNLEYIKDSEPVILEGEVRIDDFGSTFTVKEVTSLHNSTFNKNSQTKDIRLNIGTADKKQLDAIAYQLKKIDYKEGKKKLIIKWNDKETVFKENIELTISLAEELARIVGKENVELITRK